MSGMKNPTSKKPTPLWQWIVALPILGVVAVGILAYIYIGYFHPRVAQRVQTMRVEVIDRVEVLRPDGGLDLERSWLLVRVDGKDLRLAARLPEWPDVKRGDMIDVDVATGSDGALQAYGWRRSSKTP